MAAAALTASVAAVILTERGAHRAPISPGPPVAITEPTPSPTAAPGTLLLTCDGANWGQLQSNWRAISFRAGPLWFFAGRQDRYVHDANSRLHVRRPSNGVTGDVMITEVADGSTVTMKPAAEARPYFRFVDGFNGPSPNYLPAGDSGFTFSACPGGESGPNGAVTDFYLGFSFKAARPATVDIWTRPSARPIQVIFSPPGR